MTCCIRAPRLDEKRAWRDFDDRFEYKGVHEDILTPILVINRRSRAAILSSSKQLLKRQDKSTTSRNRTCHAAPHPVPIRPPPPYVFCKRDVCSYVRYRKHYVAAPMTHHHGDLFRVKVSYFVRTHPERHKSKYVVVVEGVKGFRSQACK